MAIEVLVTLAKGDYMFRRPHRCGLPPLAWRDWAGAAVMKLTTRGPRTEAEIDFTGLGQPIPAGMQAALTTAIAHRTAGK